MTAPLFVLGVSRSGTTLLRVILDRSPGIAIPDETFFIPQLAHRHPGTVDVASFLDDLRRLPRLAAWDVPADDSPLSFAQGCVPARRSPRSSPRTPQSTASPLGRQDADVHAASRPHRRLFPDALYVHLIRDGRDAALAFLDMPSGVVTKTWAHPRSADGFACEWRTEVRRAQALGRKVGKTRYLEVRYEELVADTEGVVAPSPTSSRFRTSQRCSSTPARGRSVKPHHQRLLQPPTRGVRDWQSQMSPQDAAAFEAIAGDVLQELDYEL